MCRNNFKIKAKGENDRVLDISFLPEEKKNTLKKLDGKSNSKISEFHQKEIDLLVNKELEKFQKKDKKEKKSKKDKKDNKDKKERKIKDEMLGKKTIREKFQEQISTIQSSIPKRSKLKSRSRSISR